MCEIDCDEKFENYIAKWKKCHITSIAIYKLSHVIVTSKIISAIAITITAIVTFTGLISVWPRIFAWRLPVDWDLSWL